MKKSIIIIVTSLIGITTGKMQAEMPEYLFPEFKKARMVGEGGKLFQAEVNYNFIYNQFVYIDIEDENKLKLFDPSLQIRAVKIDDRSFMITKKGIVKEILQQEPLIMVEYKGRIKSEGKEAGYNMKSETSATTSFGTIFGANGSITKLKDEQFKVMGVDKTYEIERNGKTQTFIFEARFIKLYPKKDQPVLKAYINEHKIDFNNTAQVVQLCNYAESLE